MWHCFKNSIRLLLLVELSAYVQTINVREMYKACRPEDGLHKCSKNNKCIERTKIFEIFCSTDRIQCNNDEFKCRAVERCVPRRYLNTNEGCLLGNKERIILPCRSDEYTCEKSRLCVPRWTVRNGKIECTTEEVDDDSDETTDPFEICDYLEYRCPENGRCIPREWVVDGNVDCTVSRGDEKPLHECYEDVEFRCLTSGRCIKRYRVMDGFPDCEDKSDETSSLQSCNNQTEYKCRGNGRCIPRSWILDGTENCVDGSDELPKNITYCTADEFQCHNRIRCIPKIYLCDGMDHCGDCSDEIEGCKTPHMWRCPGDSSKTCIPQSYACDAFSDCPSGVDNPHYYPGLKCTTIVNAVNEESCVIPQWTLHDDHSMCPDNSDICYVNGTFVCAHCMDNKTIISKRQLCDGNIDCRDLSDECFCMTNKLGRKNRSHLERLCGQVCYGHHTPACESCALGEVFCETNGKCLTENHLCNGEIDCPLTEIDEIYCGSRDSRNLLQQGRYNDFQCNPIPEEIMELIKNIKIHSLFEAMVPENATKCDGIIECARFEDECSPDCPQQPEVCNTLKLNTIVISAALVGSRVPFNVRTCNDFETVESLFSYLGYVIGPSICNGVKECPDGEDEINCTDRHACDAGLVQWPTGIKQSVSVGKDKLCNFIPDCVNATDELHCDTTHFYCLDGEPLYVSKDDVMDGKQDCADNSDECPPFAYDNDPFSSREEMISIAFLRYLLWIMSILAMVGNTLVILEIYIAGKRSNSVQTSAVGKCNRIMIINLALSDFLMGVALLMIGIKSALMSGQYCLQEKEWRTSGLCSLIGVSTVISSETSVFTLVVLTFYRLYGIYRPFNARNLKPKTAYIASFTTWLLSALLACIPLMPRINQFMVTDVLTEPSVYFQSTTVRWDDYQQFASRISTIGNRSSSSAEYFSYWEDTADKLQTTYPDYAPKVHGYFGYYSAHGVCIPRFFGDENSPPLHPLSLFIISLNFCSLIFIIFSYGLIYRKSVFKSNLIGSDANQENRSRSMQRKITILIGTDLCCWLPICFMTFLSRGNVVISPVAYAFAAIVLLPINSCLNPIIYSNVFQQIRGIMYSTTSHVNQTIVRRLTKPNARVNKVYSSETSSVAHKTGNTDFTRSSSLPWKETASNTVDDGL